MPARKQPPAKKSRKLRVLIHILPGKSWDEKVTRCAALANRSRSTVYKWLCDAPEISDEMYDVIEYRVRLGRG